MSRPKTFAIRWPVVIVTLLALGLVFFVLANSLFLFGGLRNHAVARDEAEIAALSAALESYYADHGRYPSSAATRALQSQPNFAPSNYIAASRTLFQALSGGTNGKVYFEFHKRMLGQDALGETYLVDSRGNAYGYSTVGVRYGTNLYDLWTTRGNARSTNNWYGN